MNTYKLLTNVWSAVFFVNSGRAIPRHCFKARLNNTGYIFCLTNEQFKCDTKQWSCQKYKYNSNVDFATKNSYKLTSNKPYFPSKLELDNWILKFNEMHTDCQLVY